MTREGERQMHTWSLTDITTPLAARGKRALVLAGALWLALAMMMGPAQASPL